MHRRLHTHLTFANVVSLIALFVALGGSGYAAVKINGKNLQNKSISGKKLKNGTISGKQVKRNTLTGREIKDHSLTGADANESSLGKVPKAGSADTATSATHANTAGRAATAGAASTLTAGGAFQSLTAVNGWTAPSSTPDEYPAGYYKDREGFVHMRGILVKNSASSNIGARLPAGYRPSRKVFTLGQDQTGAVIWVTVLPNGDVVIQPTAGLATLDTILFRAER